VARVLILTEDAAACGAVRYSFEITSNFVVSADSGADSDVMLRTKEFAPDLVILDLSTDARKGFETVRVLTIMNQPRLFSPSFRPT
jgi:DNA-binding response OmpR family regulator